MGMSLKDPSGIRLSFCAIAFLLFSGGCNLLLSKGCSLLLTEEDKREVLLETTVVCRESCTRMRS